MPDARYAVIVALSLALAGCSSAPSDEDVENPTAVLDTNQGEIRILLYANLTPQTVQNFGNLAQDDFYDGVKFHRVIQDFVVQGGDPNTVGNNDTEQWGTGGPGYAIRDEFACNDGSLSTEFTGYRDQAEPCDGNGGLALTHDGPGVISMANSGREKTGGSQFFITLGDTATLDGTHPVFGKVIGDMENVWEIGNTTTKCKQEGESPNSRTCQENRWNYPVDPIVIEDVEIEGELPGVEVDKYNQ
jgi:peptidyl-prolyl cis-trans isomerase A (cyclophilin A)